MIDALSHEFEAGQSEVGAADNRRPTDAPPAQPGLPSRAYLRQRLGLTSVPASWLGALKWYALGLMLVTAGIVIGAQLTRPHGAVLTTAPPSVTIASFSAKQTRVVLGQSTQLCYVATGAHRLRMNPSIGDLFLLRDCRRVTLRDVGRHEYTLSATGSNGDGDVAVRRVEVDVVAASTAAHNPRPIKHLAALAHAKPWLSLCTLLRCATASKTLAHTWRPSVEKAIGQSEHQLRSQITALQSPRSLHNAVEAWSGLRQSWSHAGRVLSDVFSAL
jgi:hypothetical protein